MKNQIALALLCFASLHAGCGTSQFNNAEPSAGVQKQAYPVHFTDAE